MLDQLARCNAQVGLLLEDVVQTKELTLRLGRLPNEVVVRWRKAARGGDVVLLFTREFLVFLVFKAVVEGDVHLEEAYGVGEWLSLVG